MVNPTNRGNSESEETFVGHHFRKRALERSVKTGGVCGHNSICSSGQLLWGPNVEGGPTVGDKQEAGSTNFTEV